MRPGRGLDLLGDLLFVLGEERHPAERPIAVQSFVERDAERIDVGARIDRLAAELLGRHVDRRPQQRPRPGQGRGHRLVERDLRRVLGVGGDRLLAVDAAREPEVGHPDAPVLSDEHVVGLEVAVDEAGGVRLGEPAAGAGVNGEDVPP